MIAWLKSFWTTMVFACSFLRLTLIGAKSHGNRAYLSAKVKIRHAEALHLERMSSSAHAFNSFLMVPRFKLVPAPHC